MKRLVICFALFLMVAGVYAVPAAQAQNYTSRPVQLIIPGAAGSILDVAGRLVADELTKSLGQPFISVDKPGAGFTLGTDQVAKAKKDGYTLCYTNSAGIVTSRILSPDTVPYDPDKDLDPLGLHLILSDAFSVQAGAPWKTFQELIDYAKKNPGQVKVSTTGIGSTAHFDLELIQTVTGAQFTHVPFKGGESVVTALLGGHVDACFDAMTKIVPYVESGKARVLLLASKMPQFPNIPTFSEIGYKQELFGAWFALYGPAGLPADVKKVIIPAFEKAVKNAEVKAKIEKMYFKVDYRTPAELKAMAASEYEKLMAIAIKAGLRTK
jgi:tripartite-type tricarboxylate transporter receptor subunit TctC